MADVFFTGDDRLHNYGLTLQTPCLGQSSAFAEQLAGAYEMAPDPTGCFFNPCFTNPVTTEDYASFIFKVQKIEPLKVMIEKREQGQWGPQFTGNPGYLTITIPNIFLFEIVPDNTREEKKDLAGFSVDFQALYDYAGEGIYRIKVVEDFSTISPNDLYSQPFDLVQFECGGRNVDGTVVIDWNTQGIYSNFDYTKDNRELKDYDLSNLDVIRNQSGEISFPKGIPDMRRYYAKTVPQSPSTEQNFTQFADNTNELNYTNEFLNFELIIREITYEGLMRLKFYGLNSKDITLTDYNLDSVGEFEKIDIIDSGEDISYETFAKNRKLFTSKINLRSSKGLNFKIK